MHNTDHYMQWPKVMLLLVGSWNQHVNIKYFPLKWCPLSFETQDLYLKALCRIFLVWYIKFSTHRFATSPQHYFLKAVIYDDTCTVWRHEKRTEDILLAPSFPPIFSQGYKLLFTANALHSYVSYLNLH